jgi:hypothetical protein
MVELIDHMNAKGNVWFATLAEIARHVQDLIHRGAMGARDLENPLLAKACAADRAAEPLNREVWSF